MTTREDVHSPRTSSHEEVVASPRPRLDTSAVHDATLLANETTGIVNASRHPSRSYSTHSSTGRPKHFSPSSSPDNIPPTQGDSTAILSHTTSTTRNRKRKIRQNQSPDGASQDESYWRHVVSKYGALELENKASVARDHLALERTFLAWTRTSLSFASIGIAVSQLFRLNIGLDDNQQQTLKRVHHLGRPLGCTFLAVGIVILLFGFHRYFESQYYVVRGKFPASRGIIFIVTFIAASLIITSFAVILAFTPVLQKS